MHNRNVQRPLDQLAFARVTSGRMAHFLGQTDGEAHMRAELGVSDGRET